MSTSACLASRCAYTRCFWLVTLLIAARPQVEAADAIIFVIASFVSILIHELGHAAAIAYYGWRPRITLYSLGGLASYDREYSDTFESYAGNSGCASTQIIISLAGPVAGFLFAAVIVGMVFATGKPSELFSWRLVWH